MKDDIRNKIPAVLAEKIKRGPTFSFASEFNKKSKWPKVAEIELPSPEGKVGGIVFSGIANETIPVRLVRDSLITPLEIKCWMVFKTLLNKQGLTTPSYEDLQPHLTMTPKGRRASRETVAKALTILRLTRWITLVINKGRDIDTGQILGSMYMLNDEPVGVFEVLDLDNGFIDFVGDCLTHKNKAIRIVAEHVHGELNTINTNNAYLPTRVEILAERIRNSISGESYPQTAVVSESELSLSPPVRNRATLSSESELSQNLPSSESELSEIVPSSDLELGSKTPSSESELGAKPPIYDKVRNPNQALDSTSTVLSTLYKSTSTVLSTNRQLQTEEKDNQIYGNEISVPVGTLSQTSYEQQQQEIDNTICQIQSVPGGTIQNCHNGTSKAELLTREVPQSEEKICHLENVPAGTLFQHHNGTQKPEPPAGTQRLRWPENIIVADKDRRQLQMNLLALPADMQQMVLNEASARIHAGGIRSPAGYLYSLINRAKSGNFKLWAGSSNTAPPVQQAPPSSTPTPSLKQDNALPVSSEMPAHVRQQLEGFRRGRRNL